MNASAKQRNPKLAPLTIKVSPEVHGENKNTTASSPSNSTSHVGSPDVAAFVDIHLRYLPPSIATFIESRCVSVTSDGKDVIRQRDRSVHHVLWSLFHHYSTLCDFDQAPIMK